MKLYAIDQISISSVQPDTIRPGQGFDVSDALGKELLKKLPHAVSTTKPKAKAVGAQKPAAAPRAKATRAPAPKPKAEPAPKNKAEPAPPNKTT